MNQQDELNKKSEYRAIDDADCNFIKKAEYSFDYNPMRDASKMIFHFMG